jgi:hypothetical protein
MTTILEAKDPSDLKDYAIEWSAVLTGESETAITTSTWSVSDPTGLTVLSASPHAPYIASNTKAVVWVSGGVAGTRYSLTNTIVTSGATPRTHQRTIIIPCQDR